MSTADHQEIHSSKHDWLCRSLREEARKLGYGGRLGPERELADRFNVNAKTVNKAIAELVREGVFERVRGATTFVTDRAMRVEPEIDIKLNHLQLVMNESLLTDTPFGSLFGRKMLYGMEQEARAQGLAVVIRSMDRGLVRSQDFEAIGDLLGELYRPGGCEGMILAGIAVDARICLQLRRQKINAVLLDSDSVGIKTNAIVMDNAAGTYEATEHLVRLGHRRIAYLDYDFAFAGAQERYTGYRLAAQKHGLVPEQLPRLNVSPDPRDSRTLEALEELLKDKRRPTAFVCADDYHAAAALVTCQRLGLRVPQQVSIVGFGDHLDNLLSDVTLATVCVDKAEMGRNAVRLMRDAKESDEPLRIVMPTWFEPRGSCDRAQEDAGDLA